MLAAGLSAGTRTVQDAVTHLQNDMAELHGDRDRAEKYHSTRMASFMQYVRKTVPPQNLHELCVFDYLPKSGGQQEHGLKEEMGSIASTAGLVRSTKLGSSETTSDQHTSPWRRKHGHLIGRRREPLRNAVAAALEAPAGSAYHS
eukprot:scaffold1371_cov400-Prasinococcus_capsulatus_cf.AAC.9